MSCPNHYTICENQQKLTTDFQTITVEATNNFQDLFLVLLVVSGIVGLLVQIFLGREAFGMKRILLLGRYSS